MNNKMIYILAVIGFFSVAILVGVVFSNGEEDDVNKNLSFNVEPLKFVVAEEIGIGSKVFVNCTSLIEWMKINESYVDYIGITSIWAYKCLELEHTTVPFTEEFLEDLKDMKIEIWVKDNCMGYCPEIAARTGVNCINKTGKDSRREK